MTRDAQSALRRTMENFTKVTRFVIICNYVSRIIEPITSRCAKFRYKPLSSAAMGSRLMQICKEEEVDIDEETVEALINVSEGDMRKSITMLQSARRAVSKGEKLNVSHVVEVAGIVPPDLIQKLWLACRGNAFQLVQDVATTIIRQGYPVDQVLNQLAPVVIHDDQINDIHKAKICIRLAEADKKLLDGSSEYLQLMDIMSVISTVTSE